MLYLFATTLHTALLGIILTLARWPLYPLQTQSSFTWGISSLEDQQLAGLVMWVPAGMVYAIAALTLAGIWITHSRGLSMNATPGLRGPDAPALRGA